MRQFPIWSNGISDCRLGSAQNTATYLGQCCELQPVTYRKYTMNSWIKAIWNKGQVEANWVWSQVMMYDIISKPQRNLFQPLYTCKHKLQSAESSTACQKMSSQGRVLFLHICECNYIKLQSCQVSTTSQLPENTWQVTWLYEIYQRTIKKTKWNLKYKKVPGRGEAYCEEKLKCTNSHGTSYK